jgi:PTS system N-acetylgalactosamine-specific IIA component
MATAAANQGAGGGGIGAGRARAVVAGHGGFAVGIVSAVEQITGRGELFVPIATKELGGDAIVDALRAAVIGAGASVVFTDLPAGSCTIAARRVQRERPDLIVVTGANVPALLDFVFQSNLTSTDAATRAAEKGRTALTVVGRRAD